jgi:hypothetical protein
MNGSDLQKSAMALICYIINKRRRRRKIIYI